MIFINGSLEFGLFLHGGFKNPAGSELGSFLMISDFRYENLFSMKIWIFLMKISDLTLNPYTLNPKDFLYEKSS